MNIAMVKVESFLRNSLIQNLPLVCTLGGIMGWQMIFTQEFVVLYYMMPQRVMVG